MAAARPRRAASRRRFSRSRCSSSPPPRRRVAVAPHAAASPPSRTPPCSSSPSTVSAGTTSSTNPESLPELTALRRAGVRAALRPRFVSKTFPNHWSLVTGLDEQTHGVVGNAMFDPATNRSFAMSDLGGGWDGGEPIWATAARRAPRADLLLAGKRGRDSRRPPHLVRALRRDGPVRAKARAAGVARERPRGDERARRPPPARDPVVVQAVVQRGVFRGARPLRPPPRPGEPGDARGVSPRGRRRRRRAEAAGEGAWQAANVIVVADHGMAPRRADRVVFLADAPCDLPFDELAVVGAGTSSGESGRGRRIESTPTRRATTLRTRSALGAAPTARGGAVRTARAKSPERGSTPGGRSVWRRPFARVIRTSPRGSRATSRAGSGTRKTAALRPSSSPRTRGGRCARRRTAPRTPRTTLRTTFERNGTGITPWRGRGAAAGGTAPGGSSRPTETRGRKRRDRYSRRRVPGTTTTRRPCGAVFVARGPSFRSDGAVLVGDASDGSDAIAREDVSLLTDAYYGGGAGEGDRRGPRSSRKMSWALTTRCVWSVVRARDGHGAGRPGVRARGRLRGPRDGRRARRAPRAAPVRGGGGGGGREVAGEVGARGVWGRRVRRRRGGRDSARAGGSRGAGAGDRCSMARGSARGEDCFRGARERGRGFVVRGLTPSGRVEGSGWATSGAADRGRRGERRRGRGRGRGRGRDDASAARPAPARTARRRVKTPSRRRVVGVSR